jgi:ribosomal protein S18 acetylase RimI-like enzyme
MQGRLTARIAMVSADRDWDQQRGRLPGAPFDYSIRRLQPADLEGISRVHWRACSTAYQFMNWSYTEDEVRRWYAGKLVEWDWGQVVWSSETIVAVLASIGAHIDQLFVDPDHQRVGLGSALLRAMLERRLRPATLQVFAQNTPARVFYEGFGFRQVDAWWDARDQALNLLYKLE